MTRARREGQWALIEPIVMFGTRRGRPQIRARWQLISFLFFKFLSTANATRYYSNYARVPCRNWTTFAS